MPTACQLSDLTNFLRRRGLISDRVSITITRKMADVPRLGATPRQTKTEHGRLGVVVKKGLLRRERPGTAQELKKAIARWTLLGTERRQISPELIVVFIDQRRVSGSRQLA